MTSVTTTSTSLRASARAELLRLWRWPALWVLVGVLIVLALLFGYVFDYIAYRTGSTPFGDGAGSPELLLAGLLPQAVPESLTLGMPMFAGAIMLVFGGLAAGSGYGWGAWKTVVLQGPARHTAFGGMLVALAAVVVATVLALFVAELGAALVVAAVESQAVVWPGVAASGRAIGGGILILGMWTATGVLIGVLTRSPALAIGLGLVWQLVVENLLRGVATLLGGLTVVTDVLPGTAAGSMAGALRGTVDAAGEPTPGVLTTLSGGAAGLVLVLYLAVFAAVATLVMSRRDLA